MVAGEHPEVAAAFGAGPGRAGRGGRADRCVSGAGHWRGSHRPRSGRRYGGSGRYRWISRRPARSCSTCSPSRSRAADVGDGGEDRDHGARSLNPPVSSGDPAMRLVRLRKPRALPGRCSNRCRLPPDLVRRVGRNFVTSGASKVAWWSGSSVGRCPRGSPILEDLDTQPGASVLTPTPPSTARAIHPARRSGAASG